MELTVEKKHCGAQEREALLYVLRRLDAEGVAYKVVGGMAVVLQGVPSVPVNDVDLEMPEAAVYRFQELFAEFALLPVAWREGETYRSHFGRFEILGVLFEVMADLERREGATWVPTMTVTESRVDLEELSVRVSPLEEETLAYIRRGRLERAARCLPLCDHQRLLALWRGEIPTHVI
ncbi:MAG TPA: hypothetical protein G4N98_06975 [Thermoflexia bacterium]|nr:hypothetical protein [Thermoflexia bacterium]